MFSVACYSTLDPLCRSVHPAIHPSIHPFIHWFVNHTLLFQRLWGFWACRSCPNTALTSNTAPDHPHATGVALYLALLVADWLLYKRLCPSISLSVSLCAQVEKTSISAPAHPSATGIGCVSGFVLSFLVKTNHFLYNKNGRFKNNLFLPLPNAFHSFTL